MKNNNVFIPFRELTGQLIERVATEFNKLQFLVNKSRGLPLVEEIRPVCGNLLNSCEKFTGYKYSYGLDCILERLLTAFIPLKINQ